MWITRRNFLQIMIIAPVVGIAVSRASNKIPLNISSLNISVPVWLFDEKSNDRGKIQALTAEEKKETKEIIIFFTGNRQLTLNPDTSVQWLIRRNENRPTRESMLLKRIFSFCLDAIFASIADKRNPEKGGSLKAEFDELQSEKKLEEITVGAMYDLLLNINNLPVISTISWDENNRCFIVH